MLYKVYVELVSFFIEMNEWEQGRDHRAWFTILDAITESVWMVTRPVFLLLVQQHSTIEVSKHPSKLIKRESV